MKKGAIKYNNEMVEQKTWKEFKDCGMLWLVNSTLYLFGWAIAIEYIDDVICGARPYRTKFRGFSEDVNDRGFKAVT